MEKHLDIPKVAIVGRPNVGKSSIYNRLIGRRLSIIDPTPGVTRDRHYHLVSIEDYNFQLIDTGGITVDNEDQFANIIKLQSEIAIEEADLILFVVDVNGLAEDDYNIADLLRKSAKKIIVIVNKCDNEKLEQSSVDAHILKLGDPLSVSALHGINFDLLKDVILENIPAVKIEEEGEKLIRASIVGKPNVGKSSLLNCILGRERSLVSDIPGTTRDAIRDSINFLNHEIEFLDTAGIRRKSRVHEDVEYYSVNRAVKSIEESDVAIHLIDSTENICEQDKKIMGIAKNRGRAVVIAINKWDLVDNEKDFKEYEDYIRFKFAVANYIPIINISAKTGTRIKNLLRLIIQTYDQYKNRIDTNDLNNFLQKVQKKHVPSTKKGRLKIYYGTQISVSPPKFLLFINRKNLMTKNYMDYLINQIRLEFGFKGVPIFIYLKTHR